MIARMAHACTRGRAWGWAWGCAIGAALFVYWYGTALLDPGNIGWMSQGDAATYFLTWHYFRFEPWTFPLGMVRNYGAVSYTHLTLPTN